MSLSCWLIKPSVIWLVDELKLVLDEMIEGEIVAREMEAYISQARFQISLG